MLNNKYIYMCVCVYIYNSNLIDMFVVLVSYFFQKLFCCHVVPLSVPMSVLLDSKCSKGNQRVW